MQIEHVLYVVDTHTEGEPTRIVIAGLPNIPGKSIAEKRDYIMKNMDWIRTAVIFEPRGHIDSFGAILLPAASEKADFGIIFMDSGGYLDMCGHGTMGVATALVELGFVKPVEPITEIRFETPAGIVVARAHIKNGRVHSVTVRDVPSFFVKTVDLEIPNIGKITADISFGGNFYVLVDVSQIGIEVKPKNIKKLIELGLKIREIANKSVKVEHPTKPFINKIKLVMFYEEISEKEFKNVVIFGKGSFDRSPCGTGTASRLAALYAKNRVSIGEEIISQSIIGTKFIAKIVKETRIGEYTAVIPELTGRAYITAQTQIIIDKSDPLKYGFLVISD